MQKTAYDVRISDWSSDVCSSDLLRIKNIQLNSNTITSDDNTMQVHSSATVESLTMDDASVEAVTIAKLAVTLDNSQTADILDGALRYDFGRLADRKIVV